MCQAVKIHNRPSFISPRCHGETSIHLRRDSSWLAVRSKASWLDLKPFRGRIRSIGLHIRQDALDYYVFSCGGKKARRPRIASFDALSPAQALRRILIASNGMAAAKAIMSMRQWAHMEAPAGEFGGRVAVIGWLGQQRHLGVHLHGHERRLGTSEHVRDGYELAWEGAM